MHACEWERESVAYNEGIDFPLEFSRHRVYVAGCLRYGLLSFCGFDFFFRAEKEYTHFAKEIYRTNALEKLDLIAARFVYRKTETT